jgi:hypothetical protein
MVSTRHRVRGVSLAIAATLATGALAGPAMAAEAPSGGDQSDIIVVCRKAGKDVAQYFTMRKAGGQSVLHVRKAGGGPSPLHIRKAGGAVKLKKSGPPTGFIILI